MARTRRWVGAALAGIAVAATIVFFVFRLRDAEPATAGAGAAAIGNRQAVARLQPVAGSRASGTVSFFASSGEDLGMARYRLRNLPAGPHRLRIHDRGDCSAADGTSAGDAVIDLGQLHAAPSGRAQGALQPQRLTAGAVADKAVVLTSGSGPPIACGVVRLRSK